MVRSSANILQYLVKELIDINQIKQGNFVPNLMQVSLKQIVDAGVEIMECYRI
jgi:K+-sensing histidine kinase KdpD